jgi:hypothetical protein
MQYKDGGLTGMVISCVGTAFEKKLTRKGGRNERMKKT